MTHSSLRRHWPVAWSTLIEPGMWPPNNPNLNPVIMLFEMFLNRWPINVDNSRQSTSWSRWLSLSGANCHSVWLIAPLVSGVAGLGASSSSKADTLKISCKNCEMWLLDNNWDKKHVVSVVNFLKCVVTQVVLFLLLFLRHWRFTR